MSKTKYMVFKHLGDNRWEGIGVYEARSPEAACKEVVAQVGDGVYAAVAESSWWADQYTTIVKTTVVRGTGD